MLFWRTLLRAMGVAVGTDTVATRSLAISSFARNRLLHVVSRPSQLIRLDRNENAYGASPFALTAMRDSLNDTNRYPDSEEMLRERLAAFHRVKVEQVVLGCGSSEVLGMAAAAFLAP